MNVMAGLRYNSSDNRDSGDDLFEVLIKDNENE